MIIIVTMLAQKLVLGVYPKGDDIVASHIWDNSVAKKFIHKIVTISEVGSWFPMSRSWSYRNFKEDISTGKWSEDWTSLDEFERNKIDEMIETREFTFSDQGPNSDRVIMIRKYIYDREARTAKYVVFTRNGTRITCITEDFPEDVFERLVEVWPWNLRLKDFLLIKQFTSIDLFGQKYIYPDMKTHWRMKAFKDGQTREFEYAFSVEKCSWNLGYDGYLRTNSMDALENYKEELQKLADSENKVYFASSKDPLYSSMLQWANRRSGTINQLIVTLGFTRVYKRDNPFQDILLPFDRPVSGDYDLGNKSVEERLKRLETLQGMLEKAKVESFRLTRCQELVDELKKVYRNRCQLCGEENGTIPFIEKENSDYYSEMHHIVSLSEIENLAVEWQFLDTYQNALICCPHHHRFLHYHHGGFKKLLFENGQIFLESRKGTRVRVVENLHLRER